MAEMAARHAGDNATAALLTLITASELMPEENKLASSSLEVLDEHSVSLINESPVQVDLKALR
ncbi:MAG TPA: hypothetical protein VD966_00815 [Pyrinomonadaceae bacterium]|nr:hypothetical protein [Pyrinomonadaceae bacterium]